MFITSSKKYFYANRGIGASKIVSNMENPQIVKIITKMVYGKSSKTNQLYYMFNKHLSKGPNHPGVLLIDNEKTLFSPGTHSKIINGDNEQIETEFIGTCDFNGEKKEQYINTSKPIEISKFALESNEFCYKVMPDPVNLEGQLLQQGAMAAVIKKVNENTNSYVVLESSFEINQKRAQDIYKVIRIAHLCNLDTIAVNTKKFFQNSIEEKE